jgi:hypothetical protein
MSWRNVCAMSWACEKTGPGADAGSALCLFYLGPVLQAAALLEDGEAKETAEGSGLSRQPHPADAAYSEQPDPSQAVSATKTP